MNVGVFTVFSGTGVLLLLAAASTNHRVWGHNSPAVVVVHRGVQLSLGGVDRQAPNIQCISSHGQWQCRLYAHIIMVYKYSGGTYSFWPYYGQ